MSKKIISIALGALLLALYFPAQAQQPKKMARIGIVSGAGDSNAPRPQVEALRQGLRDLGYVEGKNILFEYRYGRLDQIPGLVAELTQLKVDVLVVGQLLAIRAAKKAAETIPIVMTTVTDPVALGFVASLARPGGNITGLTNLPRI